MDDDLVKILREQVKLTTWPDAQLAMEAAADRIEALTAEVRRLNYDGIHTCHAECPRLPCVQRREIEALTAVIASLRAENQRLERVLRSIAWPMNEAGPWAQAVAASALPGGADGA